MRFAALLLVALASTALAAKTQYWWLYKNMDAPQLDIKQLPCGTTCTLAELEAACSALPTCVAFNTDGWLKNSVADMQSSTCDLYVLHDTPQPSPSVPPIAFWPLPVNVNFGHSPAVVSPQLTVKVSPSSALVSNYAKRVFNDVFHHTPGGPVPGGSITEVDISIANVNVPLELGVDESYKLVVPSSGSAIQLSANTVYGAYMGLQTLSQAVRFNFTAQQFTVAATPLTISDSPKFAWRGILMDTDRHWLSIRHIKQFIDAMGYAKLNTLHWHIVDWQAWPLESKALENLWEAAWSAQERYTLNDVTNVIAFANERGIRVVPEFDTPGHATSMCVGYPELCCSASCGPGNNYPLSPVPNSAGANVALNAIQAVLSELSAISPDTFFHLGGDEVDQSCWKNTPAVQQWMAQQNPPLTTTDQVYEYFVAKVDAMTLAMNKLPVRWEEVWAHFGTQLDQRTIIHAWLSQEAVINCTSKGYRAIWSVDGQYYLDDLSEPWQKFYDVDILAGITNTSAIPLVLGGETCMWGETADGSDVLQTVWPRAAAAAERQWSYDVVTNSSDPEVALRLHAFRCLLLERGVPVAPLNNAQARQAPPGPGSCLAQ